MHGAEEAYPCCMWRPMLRSRRRNIFLLVPVVFPLSEADISFQIGFGGVELLSIPNTLEGIWVNDLLPRNNIQASEIVSWLIIGFVKTTSSLSDQIQQLDFVHITIEENSLVHGYWPLSFWPSGYMCENKPVVSTIIVRSVSSSD